MVAILKTDYTSNHQTPRTRWRQGRCWEEQWERER